MRVVRVAPQRPYSCFVLALLTAIFGVLAALNTPTDILTERLAIALRTRQLVASIVLMLALGGA